MIGGGDGGGSNYPKQFSPGSFSMTYSTVLFRFS
jgi:hypothetical protein